MDSAALRLTFSPFALMLPLMAQPLAGSGSPLAAVAAVVAAGAATVVTPGALLLPPRGCSLRHFSGSSKLPFQMPRPAARAASSRGT